MKPILVGESNPYGSDPYYALYPAPNGCAGHRLCCVILGMRRQAYLDSFARVNLCEGKWSITEARAIAHEVCMSNERVILLGARVASAFSLAFQPLLRTGLVDVRGRHPRREVLVLPHPSGRCRLWSESGMMRRAREAVARFCPELGLEV